MRAELVSIEWKFSYIEINLESLWCKRERERYNKSLERIVCVCQIWAVLIEGERLNLLEGEDNKLD